MSKSENWAHKAEPIDSTVVRADGRDTPEQSDRQETATQETASPVGVGCTGNGACRCIARRRGQNTDDLAAGRLVTDGGTGAIDHDFAAVEQPPLHVGDHVADREADEQSPMLVVGKPGAVAEEYAIGEGGTVADYNEAYPATDGVIEVVYPNRTDAAVTDTRYAFPRSRLRLTQPIHDRDGGDSR